MNIKKGIELTNEEFFFLASLFRCNALIGVPDPFLGYWIEEIEAGMKRAAGSLVQKGYIVYKNDEPELMPELLEYMRICTKTNMTFWLQSERGGKQEECYFYLSARKVIESRVFEEGDRLSYVLRERGNPAQTWNEILDMMRPQEKPPIYDGTITLPLEVFADLLDEREYYSVKHIGDILQKKNVPREMASILAKAIKECEYYGQFTAFYHIKGEWRINNLRLLCHEGGNWIATNIEKQYMEYVELRSVSCSEFLNEMKNVIIRTKQPSISII
ncbi:MAG: hypothetical protein ACE3JP_16290 [Ectobacillus sp.]